MSDENQEEVPEAGDPVWYIKMVNGDDVFAVLRATEQFLVLKDPMVITTSIDMVGNKYMTLHRWASFSANPIVKIVPANVMVCEPLSDPMIAYYWSSVTKHQLEIDPSFDDAAREAAKTVSAPIDQEPATDTDKALAELEEKFVLSRRVPTSNTKN